MNLCLFSIQTILLVVIVVQYHHINEVDAESLSVGNWFNSVEKNFENFQNEAEIGTPRREVTEKTRVPKKKRRIMKRIKKKINKNNKAKHGHHEHIPHEQRLDAIADQDKTEFPKKVIKVNHKKRGNDKVINKRQFVKTSPKESNSSESDEVKRRKPVDIIVHIKMND